MLLRYLDVGLWSTTQGYTGVISRDHTGLLVGDSISYNVVLQAKNPPCILPPKNDCSRRCDEAP